MLLLLPEPRPPILTNLSKTLGFHLSFSISAPLLVSTNHPSVMASSSSCHKRIKRMATKQQDPDIDGWISDPKAQDNFSSSFRNRKIINHKHVKLPFFRTHGFAFPEFLSFQNLETFVQLKGNVYPDLIRVFYANLQCEEDLLTSRVKEVNIVLTPEIWTSIAGFRIAGILAHRGFPGANRLDIYQSCLRDPIAKRDYNIFRAGGMKKDERVLAFIIAWILVPRNGNHAQLTTEDVFLIHAFKSNILIDWSEVVFDTMQKAIKLPNYPLPYVVFLCKVIEHYKVDFLWRSFLYSESY